MTYLSYLSKLGHLIVKLAVPRASSCAPQHFFLATSHSSRPILWALSLWHRHSTNVRIRLARKALVKSLAFFTMLDATGSPSRLAQDLVHQHLKFGLCRFPKTIPVEDRFAHAGGSDKSVLKKSRFFSFFFLAFLRHWSVDKTEHKDHVNV